MYDKIEDAYAEGYTADVVETFSRAPVVAKKKKSVVETREKSKIRRRRDNINNEKN